jgi:hypothetical protein
MALPTTPALNANDGITRLKDPELDGIQYAPLETLVNVFLPRHFSKIWLVLREDEWVNSTVKVRVLRMLSNMQSTRTGSTYTSSP